MISRSAEYSLRAVISLAEAKNAVGIAKTGCCVSTLTTPQIAQRCGVPLGYLAKILTSLSRARIINSQRGAGGGHGLARPSDRITLLQVIQAIDPCRRIRFCPLGIASHGTNLCALHRKLDDAIAMAERELSSATIADVIPHERCCDLTVQMNAEAQRRRGEDGVASLPSL
jgi:Rrf2 family transcriptional regulator, nitric oxide-sensitive transcriptional repressor